MDALLAGIGETLAHPTVVMRADVLRAVGGYHVDAMPVEDFALWLRLGEMGELANLPEQLVRYRRHRETVCVRERPRQLKVTDALVGVAREQRKLPRLRPRRAPREVGSDAAYHLECARIALKTGRRAVTARHAWASLVSAPFWLAPYAALLACVLPTRVVHRLVHVYTRLREVSIGPPPPSPHIRKSAEHMTGARHSAPAPTSRREAVR
jgi:hypothetical protein